MGNVKKMSIVETMNGTVLYFVNDTYTLTIDKAPGQPPSEDLITFTHTASNQISFQALRKNLAYIRMNIPRGNRNDVEVESKTEEENV